MIEFSAFLKNNFEVESILLHSSSFFVVVSVFVFLLTIYSRYRKISFKHLETKYEPIIENMLMSVLFMDMNYESIKDKTEYQPHLKKKLFRKCVMASVINLHQNYDGAYAKRLENFYSDSKLLEDSFTRLKSRKWEEKCKAMTELAEMKVTQAFDKLAKLTTDTKNQTIKITAIHACMKLDATKGIILLVKHKHPIDNWEQLNIIDALKRGDIEKAEGIELLLRSENSTVVSLGLKIIQSFDLSALHPFVLDFITQTKENDIKAEATKLAGLFSISNDLI